MSVAVYPRLSAILEERHLSINDLERQIAERYGITVDPGTLQELMQAAPVERTDLAAAGATAAVLGVGLDDLFSVLALPVPLDLPESEPVLGPEKSRRLDELFGRQDEERLTPADRAEMEALVKELGKALFERGVHEFATRHGIPVEQARNDMATELSQAVEWWRRVDADPASRRAVVATAKDLASAASPTSSE